MRKILEHCYALCESCRGRKDGYEPLVQNYLDDLLNGKYSCRGNCTDFEERGENACFDCVSSWMEYLQLYSDNIQSSNQKVRK